MKARRNELTAAQGRKLIAEMVAISSGEQMPAHTVRGWFEEWLSNKTASVGGPMTARCRRVLEGFLTHLGGRSNAPLAAISPKDIASFRDRLRAEGRTARTTNSLALGVLSLPFSSALRLGHIATNPCAAVDPIKDRAEARTSGREPFTGDEVAALVAHAEGDWKGAIILGATSGLRLGDIANLKWEALDLEAGLLRLQTQKTDAVVVVPLHAGFLDWLAGQPRGIAKAHIFPKSGRDWNRRTQRLVSAVQRHHAQGRRRRTGFGTRRGKGTHPQLEELPLAAAPLCLAACQSGGRPRHPAKAGRPFIRRGAWHLLSP